MGPRTGVEVLLWTCRADAVLLDRRDEAVELLSRSGVDDLWLFSSDSFVELRGGLSDVLGELRRFVTGLVTQLDLPVVELTFRVPPGIVLGRRDRREPLDELSRMTEDDLELALQDWLEAGPTGCVLDPADERRYCGCRWRATRLESDGTPPVVLSASDHLLAALVGGVDADPESRILVEMLCLALVLSRLVNRVWRRTRFGERPEVGLQTEQVRRWLLGSRKLVLRYFYLVLWYMDDCFERQAKWRAAVRDTQFW